MDLPGFSTRARTVSGADGARIAYRVFVPAGEDEEAGRARPTVVLSNGIGCNDVFWRDTVLALGRAFRLVAWDYRAHGGSEVARAGGYSMRTQADDLARVVRDVTAGARGPAPMHVGFSMGVCVLLAFWERHAPLARALALVKGPARAPLSSRLPMALPGGLAVTRGVLRALRPAVPLAAPAARLALRSRGAYWVGRATRVLTRRSPQADVEDFLASMSTIDPLAYWETLRALMAFDGRPVLPTIRVPVLLVAGERDNLVTHAEIEAMRRAIPGARATLVRDAGHAGLLEAGPEIATILGRFLGRASAG